MRLLAFGLFLSIAAAVPACAAPTVERRELQPLPGVTTPTTQPASTTSFGGSLPGDTLPPTTVAGATDTTLAPTTVTPTTVVPGTTPPPTSSVPPTTGATPSAGSRWAFGDFRSVPRLGSEPVRGDGCGADGSVGDTLPDGWWLGIVAADGRGELQFDLVCAYFGTSAQAMIAECQATAAGSTCTAYFDDEFWPVNRNTRERTVPKASSYRIEEVSDLCSVGVETRTGGITGELDWLLVENRAAVYLRRGCGTE